MSLDLLRFWNYLGGRAKHKSLHPEAGPARTNVDGDPLSPQRSYEDSLGKLELREGECRLILNHGRTAYAYPLPIESLYFEGDAIVQDPLWLWVNDYLSDHPASDLLAALGAARHTESSGSQAN